MEPAEAVATVLRDAAGPLHWTVIQDRALKQGYLDPFVLADVRGEVLTALRQLTSAGTIERVDKGTYQLAGRAAGPPFAGQEP